MSENKKKDDLRPFVERWNRGVLSEREQDLRRREENINDIKDDVAILRAKYDVWKRNPNKTKENTREVMKYTNKVLDAVDRYKFSNVTEQQGNLLNGLKYIAERIDNDVQMAYKSFL